MNWPVETKAPKTCGCGAERTTEISLRASRRSGRPRNKPEYLGSVSRTLCDDCAQAAFHEASHFILRRTTEAPDA